VTPAGRPPRSSTSATKTITLRVTIEEHRWFTKAARGKYVSEWLRELAVAAATPVENPTTAVGFRAAVGALFERLPEERREKMHEQVDDLMQKLETMMKYYENRIADLTYEMMNQDVELATKFAHFIKHERGCKGRPCTCFLRDIAISVSTALAMDGGSGDIPIAD
jgi:hypothetical protein